MGTISEMGVGSCRGGIVRGELSEGGGGVSGYPILLIDHTESIFIPAMVALETRTSVCPPRRRACLLIVFAQKKYSFELARIRTHDLFGS